MRLHAATADGQRHLTIDRSDGREVLLHELAPDLADDQPSLLLHLTDAQLRARLRAAADRVDPARTRQAAPAPEGAGTPAIEIDHVLGIGLNYRAHAADLGAPEPQEPAWFTKLARTAGGTGSTVLLPPDSRKVTAEAELGLVVGRTCWRVAEPEALDVIAGAVAILDHCAEDILHRNTRFLTRSKNFPTFLTVGSELVTLDELLRDDGLAHLEVTTRSSDGAAHRGAVADMLFSPARIVSELSAVVPLRPGDLISTGTPGAVTLADGDRVTGEVSGVGTVTARVHRPGADAYRAQVLAQLPHLDTRSNP